jgi:allene oxide cyclase
MRAKLEHLSARRHTSRIAIAAIALALAAWFAIGAPRAADAAKARKASGTTIHVIEHAVTDTTVQSGGGTGDKTGNVLTFHNKVYDSHDAKRVGTDQGFCVRISPADGSWECLWTTFLAKGQITVEGPFFDTHNSVLAITGGTRAYRNARGEMNLNSLKGGKEYDFIFHLSP